VNVSLVWRCQESIPNNMFCNVKEICLQSVQPMGSEVPTAVRFSVDPSIPLEMVERSVAMFTKILTVYIIPLDETAIPRRHLTCTLLLQYLQRWHCPFPHINGIDGWPHPHTTCCSDVVIILFHQQMNACHLYILK
jgi:hypothetical protein